MDEHEFVTPIKYLSFFSSKYGGLQKPNMRANDAGMNFHFFQKSCIVKEA